MPKQLSVCLVAGGPSDERGISLNSARSVCDHLAGDDISVERIIYYDTLGRAYRLPKSDLYSNTPSDFDFTLQAHGHVLSETELDREFINGLIFPVIHGAFGEDGALQKRLESCNAAFVGSSSGACYRAFHKGRSAEVLAAHGFPVIPQLVARRDESGIAAAVRSWAGTEHLTWPFIVKPAIGGSSIGVSNVNDNAELEAAATELFANNEEIIVQPRCLGREFTVVVLESTGGKPVALLPTEIDKRQAGIFTYRQKYLPSGEVAYHTPPTFGEEIVRQIRAQAEEIFRVFEMRDFARIDGWLLDDGNIVFCDLNPISGMEQNSFLFQQGARAGFSHAALLRHVVRNACRRLGFSLPAAQAQDIEAKIPVAVLFGGASSERQVSLMSGTNVWLKLRASQRYRPQPYLLTADDEVWHVPYAAALNHTVEEVRALCEAESTPAVRNALDGYRRQLRIALGVDAELEEADVVVSPSVRTLDTFLNEESRVFLSLHGGIGEDGTLQAEFEQRGIAFNGSGSAASRLCIDKAKTGAALAGLESRGITIPGKWADSTEAWLEQLKPELWTRLQTRLGTAIIIVKPQSDGCSTGVVPLSNYQELYAYLDHLRSKARSIPDGVFSLKHGRTELPLETPADLLFETFIATDEVRVTGDGKLRWQEVNKWIEVTVGVIGRSGAMRALHPSLTIALDGVLSLEEKFMGGTGVNLTPPPTPPLGRVSPAAIASARERIALVANTLDLSGYARIDAFMHIETGEINVIEVNTLPGLTASTVLFHQALAETPPLFPVEFLATIADFMESNHLQRMHVQNAFPA